MAKFKMTPTTPTGTVVTARVGGTSSKLVDEDVGKFVKLAADSEYDLCAAGDPIQGQFIALESATQDNFAIGSVKLGGRINALCDGLEATAGTGTIAVGDFVVCGTVVAAGTAMTSTTGPKVCKATNQPGAAIDVSATVNQTTVNAALALAADQLLNAVYGWRVVSVGSAGAVGDTCVIERVNVL